MNAILQSIFQPEKYRAEQKRLNIAKDWIGGSPFLMSNILAYTDVKTLLKAEQTSKQMQKVVNFIFRCLVAENFPKAFAIDNLIRKDNWKLIFHFETTLHPNVHKNILKKHKLIMNIAIGALALSTVAIGLSMGSLCEDVWNVFKEKKILEYMNTNGCSREQALQYFFDYAHTNSEGVCFVDPYGAIIPSERTSILPVVGMTMTAAFTTHMALSATAAFSIKTYLEDYDKCYHHQN